MLGRGLVARPDLALQIVAARAGVDYVPLEWASVLPLLQDYWRQQRARLPERFAPGRLKQWLAWLARSYPEAEALFAAARRESDCARLDALVGAAVPAQ